MKSRAAVLVALLFAGNLQANDMQIPDLSKLKAADLTALKSAVSGLILLSVKEIAEEACKRDVTFLNRKNAEGKLQILGDRMLMEFKAWEGALVSGTVKMQCLGGVLYQFQSEFQVYGEPVLEDHLFRGKLK